MTSKAFRQIEKGLLEALAYARGEDIGAVVHHIEVPDTPDVKAIRARTGLSQAEFARSIGVKKATLLNWEQERRMPDGPARVLLALIAKEPGIVQRVLSV
jgi:putative transcriptional regulator